MLTLGHRTQNYPEADVLIEDGRVVEVGPALRSRGAEVIDGSDTIVMPGFVDSHRHVWQAILRSSDARVDVSEVMARITPDDVYAATLIGLLGSVESGVTTVVDWCDMAGDPSLLEPSLQAHRDAGIRTVLVTPASEGAIPTVHDRTPLTSVAAGSDDVEPGRVDALASQWSHWHGAGLRVHAHAGNPDSPAGAVASLHQLGALGDHVTLAHGTHLDAKDLDAVAESGTKIALTPSSEMAGGLGTPPMQKLLDRDIRPGLGVDTERIAPGDMFAQMRAAISIQHAEMFDLKLAGKGSLPNLLTTRQVIRYGTIDSAAAAGLAPVIGSIEPGKRADLIILRTDRPNIAPVNDPIGAVVWGMDTSNLDWVFVDGVPLMREGELIADTDHARRLVSSAKDNLLGSLLVDSGDDR